MIALNRGALLVGTTECYLYHVDPKTMAVFRDREMPPRSAVRALISADNLIYAGCDDGKIHVLSAFTLNTIRVIKGHLASIRGMAMKRGKKRTVMYTCGLDGCVRVSDVNSGVSTPIFSSLCSSLVHCIVPGSAGATAPLQCIVGGNCHGKIRVFSTTTKGEDSLLKAIEETLENYEKAISGTHPP